MKDWAINVRAVVRLSGLGQHEGFVAVEDWEIYDWATLDEDVQVRCERIVVVQAETQEEAVEAAKSEAPAIEFDKGAIEEIKLWVDESIDVDPEHAEIVLAERAAAASPSP